jgi:hypothetical protein
MNPKASPKASQKASFKSARPQGLIPPKTCKQMRPSRHQGGLTQSLIYRASKSTATHGRRPALSDGPGRLGRLARGTADVRPLSLPALRANAGGAG